MPENKPLLIIDLDGTLLSVNSFPHWVKYLLFGRFRGLSMLGRFNLTARTCFIVLKKKLLRQKHFIAKRKLQVLWQEALSKDPHKTALIVFIVRLHKYVRPNFKAVLEAVINGDVDAVLATAAAGEYAHTFAESLGFTNIITTPLCSVADARENVREQKRDNVLAFLATKGWDTRRRIFFTDHEEDLPLMLQSHGVLWFGKERDMEALKARQQQLNLHYALNLNKAELMEISERLAR